MMQSSHRISSDMNAVASNKEYIDFIDVVEFIWQSKIWTGIGILVGLLVTALVISKSKPTMIVTHIPVTIEEPGGFFEAGLQRRFSDLLERDDFKSNLWNALGADAKKNVLVAGTLPFLLIPNGTKYELEINHVNSDPSGEAGLKVAHAVGQAAREINEKLLTGSLNKSKILSDSSKLRAKVESNIAKVIAQKAADEVEPYIKLYKLQNRLIHLVGLNSAQTVQLASGSPADSILKILGFASEKLTPKDRMAIVNEYATALGTLRTIDLKYSPAVQELSANFPSFSNELIEKALGEFSKVPVIAVDEPAFRAAVANHKFQRCENRTPFLGALGIIFGGLFGLVTFAAYRYILEHRERLLAAIGFAKGGRRWFAIK